MIPLVIVQDFDNRHLTELGYNIVSAIIVFSLTLYCSGLMEKQQIIPNSYVSIILDESYQRAC